MSRVADDLYLIAHDERSGRCRVPERVAGLGLAAALLGELMLSGHLTLHAGGVYPLPIQDPVQGSPVEPGDRLLQAVLHLVRDPRQDRDLGIWLTFLAAEAVPDVRRRLLEDGVLARVAVRRVGVRRVLHLPTDPNAAVWPGIRLAGLLSRRDPVTAADAALVCIVAAIGLLGHVLWFPDEHAPGWEHTEAIRRSLPPVLAHLVARAEAAVGDRVMTHRSG